MIFLHSVFVIFCIAQTIWDKNIAELFLEMILNMKRKLLLRHFQVINIY